MSTTIDEKVVSMRFDNEQFESGVKTSMSTLDKLRKSLKLDGATSGLDTLNKTAKSIDLSGISDGINTISSRFTSMGIVGTTILQNLTTEALHFSKKIVSALTIDPVKTGFTEYNQQIQSTMVIMSNLTDETLENVTKALDELNVYADKTVYSFTDMTTAIGKFAAAGVNLKDSVAAIKGLSNAAALVGANGMQLYSAYYNLSQSLQGGYLTTIDYNSLANSTIMNSKMRKLIVDTAVEMGKFSADSELATRAYQDFKSTLSEKWVTSDIILATLAKYSDAETEIGSQATAAAIEVKTLSQLWDTMKESVQTGWADSWKIVVGDLNESKKLFTTLSQTFEYFSSRIAENRLEMLSGWKELGGRDDLIQSIYNSFYNVLMVLTPIKDGIRDIFPKTTSEQLAEITRNIREFTSNVLISKDAADGLQNIIRGLLTPLKIASDGLKIIGKISVVSAAYVWYLSQGFLSLFSSTDRLASAVKMLIGDERYLRIASALSTIASNMGAHLSHIVSEIGKIIKGIKDLPGVQKLLERIFHTTDNISEVILDKIVLFFENLARSTSKLYSFGDKVLGALDLFFMALAKGVGIIESVVGGVTSIAGGMLNLAGSFDLGRFAVLAFGAVMIGVLARGGEAITDFFKLLGMAKDIIKTPFDALKTLFGVFDAIGDVIDSAKLNLLSGALRNVAISVGILAAALLAISGIEIGPLIRGLTSLLVLGGAFVTLTFAINKLNESMNGIEYAKFVGLLLSFGAISKSIAASIGIIAVSFKLLASINFGQTLTSLIAILGTIGGITLAFEGISKHIKDFKKGTFLLAEIAVSVGILASAVKKLSTLSPDQIVTGLVGMASSLTAICVAIGLLSDKVSSLHKGTKIILEMALATGLLSLSLKTLSSLDFGQAIIGLTSVTGLMTSLATVIGVFSSKVKEVRRGSIIFLTMAGSVMLMANAIKILGTMNPDALSKGLFATIGTLVALATIVGTLSYFVKDLAKGSSIFISLGIGLTFMASAIKTLGKIPFQNIVKGITGLGVAIGIMLGTVNLLSKFASEGIKGASALIVLGAAMMLITPSIKILSGIRFSSLVSGLIGLAGSMIILGGSAVILSNFALEALKGAGAIAVLSIAMGLFTPSLLALSAVPTGTIIESLIALAGALGVMGVAASLIGAAWQPILIGAGIILALDAVLALSTVTIKFFANALNTVLDPLNQLAEVPILSMAGGLLAFGPAATIAGVGGLTLLAAAPGILAYAGALEVLAVAITSLSKALDTAGNVFNAGLSLGKDLLGGIASALGINSPSKEAAKLGDYTTQGMVIGVNKGLDAVYGSGVDTGLSYIEGVTESLDIHSPSKVLKAIADWAIKGFTGGASDGNSSVQAAGEQTGWSYIQGIVGSLISGEGTVSDALSSLQGMFGNVAADGSIQEYINRYVNTDGLNKATEEIVEDTGEIDSSVSDMAQGLDSSAKSAGGSAQKIEDAFSKIRDSLKSTMNIFEEFNMGDQLSKWDLFRNIGSQIYAISDWSESLIKLTNRGFSEALVRQMAEMGTASYKYIEGFLSMTDGEVEFYNTLYDISQVIADDAVENLKIALPETLAEVMEETGKTYEQVGKDLEETTYSIVSSTEKLSESIEDAGDDFSDQLEYVDAYAESMKHAEDVIDSTTLAYKRNHKTLTSTEREMVSDLYDLDVELQNNKQLISEIEDEFQDWLKINYAIEPGQLTLADAIRNYSDEVANFSRTIEATSIYSNINRLENRIAALNQQMKYPDADPSKTFKEAIAFYGKTDNEISTWFGENVDKAADQIVESQKKYNEMVSDAKKAYTDTGYIDYETGWYFRDEIEVYSKTKAAEIVESNIAKDKINDDVENMLDTTIKAKKQEKGIVTDTYRNEVMESYNSKVKVVKDTIAKNKVITETAQNTTDKVISGVKAVTNTTKKSTKEIENSFKALYGVTTKTVYKFAGAIGNMLADIAEFKGGLKNTIEDSINLFEKFDDEVEMTGEDMLNNMHSQINGIMTWTSNLSTLANRGLDNGLLKSLAEMGPKSYKYVSAFVSMTDDQLREANSLYSQSLTLSDTSANSITESFKQVGMWTIEGYINGILENQSQAENCARALGYASLNALKQSLGIGSPSKITYDYGGWIVEGAVNGINDSRPTAVSSANNLAYSILLNVQNLLSHETFYSIGANVVNGLAAGIDANIQTAINASTRLADAVTLASKVGFDINSPSKVFAEIGKYNVMGLANGIHRYTYLATESIDDLRDSSINNMMNTIAGISDYLNSDINTEPVIRPVLDLSEIQNGTERINSSFGKTGISMSGILRKTDEISKDINGSRITDTNNMSPENGGQQVINNNFTQNNYSPKALSRRDIYRQTRNQINQMKGVVKTR